MRLTRFARRPYGLAASALELGRNGSQTSLHRADALLYATNDGAPSLDPGPPAPRSLAPGPDQPQLPISASTAHAVVEIRCA